ncbi:protein FAR1-RELATED SEQUENCE 5-like [Silene latifolia]|uniref:protein FAR1-RELATED SEQUENCE 5-like n=1 Tax=Silene latifolia TaxID=37657 RepID=UPI003D78309D
MNRIFGYPTHLKPVIGMVFDTLELGIAFYEAYGNEWHNHMPATPLAMVHLTQTRELNIVHKKMIVDNSKVNKGPVMTYRMFKEYVRGYQNVGASLEDFKNFSRDIKKFLSEGDAQMLIEHFMKIKRICPSFYFDFEVDEKGVDHHKRCVTFGTGLLINESKESFAWLFTKFLEAMGGRYPVCIITDEDLGIEGGLKKVLKNKVQHRYCMWHILKKLSEKVGPVICRETEFLKEINSCVWGEDVEPAEFEERWTSIVEAHGLSDNEWLQEKYGIRHFWIPAYFHRLMHKRTNRPIVVEMFTCVSLVEQSPVNCDELLTILREFKERVLAETTSSVADDGGNSSIGKKRDKNAEIGMLLGTCVPSEITILPPRQCKNKGSGKRMISQRERAGEVNKKPLRRCKACGQMANHDSRNCDRPKDN